MVGGGRTKSSRSAWAYACVAATFSLTAAPAAHAYRTASDSPEFAGAGIVRWEEPRVTIHIRAITVQGMTHAAVDDIARASLSRWSDQPCAARVFEIGTPVDGAAAPGDGLNTIEWVRTGWGAHGFRPDAGATTDVQYTRDADGHWRIVEADIYLNDEAFDFAVGDPDGDGPTRDLRAILVHEFGHFLGLLHSCEPGGADGAPDCGSDPAFTATTMHPEYRETQNELGTDELAAACALYPSSPCESVSCAGGQVCASGACIDACGGRVCGSGESCIDGACAIPMCVDPSCMSPSTLRRPEGDPCSFNADCESDHCEAAYCRSECNPTVGCAGSARCEPVDATLNLCIADTGRFGDGCEFASDCVSRVCLDRSSGAPLCSRLCAGTQGPCPSDFECTTLAGMLVCTPVAPPSGCSIGGRHDSSASSAGIAGAVLAVSLLSVRRRRRVERQS